LPEYPLWDQWCDPHVCIPGTPTLKAASSPADGDERISVGTSRNISKDDSEEISSNNFKFLPGGYASDILMKVNLNMVGVELCNKTYRNMGSKLYNGIQDDQQVCAGVLEGGKDTCQVIE